MKNTFRIARLALALAFAGCVGAPSDPGTPVPLLARTSNECPCCVTRGAWLLRCAEDERAHHNCGFKSSDFATIDWSREWVVSVTSGEDPRGGRRVRIDSVVRQGETLVVTVTEDTPATPSPGPSKPYSIVKIPAQPGATNIRLSITETSGGPIGL